MKLKNESNKVIKPWKGEAIVILMLLLAMIEKLQEEKWVIIKYLISFEMVLLACLNWAILASN